MVSRAYQRHAPDQQQASISSQGLLLSALRTRRVMPLR